MSENTLETTVEHAETDTNNNAAEVKTYTQDEVDAMMARTRQTAQKRAIKAYEDLGDPETLRTIVTEHSKREKETQLKRGEFDKVIQEMASKKDAEISKRDSIIQEYKIEQPLVSLAAQYRSVNPEQVKQLLKSNVRLNEDGDVEVLDPKTNSVRYDDSGKPLTVDTYVQEFLAANPHFTSATPATANTVGNIDRVGHAGAPIDLSNLDLTRADHRKIYADARRNGKLQ